MCSQSPALFFIKLPHHHPRVPSHAWKVPRDCLGLRMFQMTLSGSLQNFSRSSLNFSLNLYSKYLGISKCFPDLSWSKLPIYWKYYIYYILYKVYLTSLIYKWSRISDFKIVVVEAAMFVAWSRWRDSLPGWGSRGAVAILCGVDSVASVLSLQRRQGKEDKVRLWWDQFVWNSSPVTL